MMNAVLLALVLGLAPQTQGVTQCSRCHQEYHTGRLSRSQMIAIADKTLSRHGTRTGRTSLVEIARRESGFNPLAKNKDGSSAYGLFGFLKTTWKGTGIKKTNCPHCQTEAGVRYIKGRYGTPEKALEFHKRKGWY